MGCYLMLFDMCHEFLEVLRSCLKFNLRALFLTWSRWWLTLTNGNPTSAPVVPPTNSKDFSAWSNSESTWRTSQDHWPPGCFDTIPSCVSWENDRRCAHPNFHKTLDTHFRCSYIFAGASIPASIDLKVSNKESMSLSLAKSESHTCRPEYLTRWKARQPLTVKRIHTQHYQNSLLKTFS